MFTKSLYATVLIALLALALSPAYAQPATDTASLPICSVLDGRPWMPGFFSAFAVDAANITNRTPYVYNGTGAPPVMSLGPGSLNANETVHAGEVLSLYGMAFFPKLGAGGTTGPATKLNGMQVFVNGKPATIVYAGFRRDGQAGMTHDNQELAFAIPANVVPVNGKLQFALVSTDMTTDQACRGQNSPFELPFNAALTAPRYELVFPVGGGDAELRMHGHRVSTFPSATAPVADAKQ